MQDVRVVVRRAGRGADYDLALDGVACGRLPGDGERRLSVEAGPHSLFVNAERFREGAIKAFVAVPGADVCLWVGSTGITRRPRFLEPQEVPRRPAPLRWLQALMVPLILVAPLAVQAVGAAFVSRPSTDWTPGAVSGTVFGAVLGSVCLARLWVGGPTHRWRALIVAEVVLVAVLVAAVGLVSGVVAVNLTLIAAIWASAFAFAAATRGRSQSTEPVPPLPVEAPPVPR